MKYIKKTILSILIAASIVLMPISAYCLDTVYVSNPEIWYSDSRVVNMSEQNLENYNGIYSYYADTEHACFYLHISYNEKNLKNEGNDIKV
ncbi:MAG: hypothetical protein K2F65_02770 [Eubacterium sp.]|nr:hypothetical protein [Eubacterium sp.]